MIKLTTNNNKLSLSDKALIKGDDGGYYIPTVDDGGNLTWTGSAEDMPAIEPANIKGEDGAQGKNAYEYAQDGGYKGTEQEFADKLAKDYPVQSVNGKTGKVVLTADDVKAPTRLEYEALVFFHNQHEDRIGELENNKLDATALDSAINTALAEAKESGEFDGEPGKDGKDGKDGAQGIQGEKGEPGYTPVKGIDYFDGRDGKDGEPGKDGTNGKDGADGMSPHLTATKSGNTTTITMVDAYGSETVTIEDGKDGKDGTSGADGIPATHSWNGTVLTITSASGTSSADLKGAPGEPAPATAVLYTKQTLTTAQQEQARANLGIVGEEQYEFADSVEDIPADADKSKKYVIDGYIYTYQTKTEEKKHNANDGTGAINKRPNTSGATSVALQSQSGVWTSPLIEIDPTQCAPTSSRLNESNVVISGLSQIVPAFNSSSIWVWYYKADGTKYYTLKGSQLASVKTDAAITLPLTFQLKDTGTFADSNWANVRYARIVLGISTSGDITENDIAGLVVNMPFFDRTETVSGWYSTGQEFSGDKATQQNTADIASLKIDVETLGNELEEVKNTINDIDLINIKTGQVLYAVGDSITYGYGIGGNDYSWVKYVIEQNGYNAASSKNLGQSGLGFCSTSTSGNTITDIVGGTNFSGADIVTVALGINDWKNANATLTEYWAGMEYCFNKIRTDNPYCKIFYILPFNARFLGTYDTFYCLGARGDSNTARPYAYTLQTFINMIKDKLEEDSFKAFHINVIDMVECAAINRHNITTALIDYTHPSADTQIALGKEIARRIALT